MNFTTTRTAPGFSRRISWHFVSLASGLTLAAAVAVAGGVFQRSGGQVRSDAVAQPPIAVVGAGPQTAVVEHPVRTVLYIVSSEAEGIALAQQAYEAGHEAPGVDRRVLVADSTEDEAAVLTAIGEGMQLQTLEVVDLRQ